VGTSLDYSMLVPLSSLALPVFSSNPERNFKARSHNFPTEIVLVSHNGYLIFESEFCTIRVIENKFLSVEFRTHLFSNFCEERFEVDVNGSKVAFCGGEHAFKAACAVSHIGDDPANEVTKLALDALKAVLLADEPSKAKRAPFIIKPFNIAGWNAMSLDVMTAIQSLKFQNPETYDFLQMLLNLAKEHGISSENCFFVEITVPDNYGVDLIWGNGISMKEMTEKLEPTLFQNLLDTLRDTAEVADRFYPGKNLLGLALKNAMAHIHINQSVKEYTTTGEKAGIFRIFAEISVEEKAAATVVNHSGRSLSCEERVSKDSRLV